MSLSANNGSPLRTTVRRCEPDSASPGLEFSFGLFRRGLEVLQEIFRLLPGLDRLIEDHLRPVGHVGGDAVVFSRRRPVAASAGLVERLGGLARAVGGLGGLSGKLDNVL